MVHLLGVFWAGKKDSHHIPARTLVFCLLKRNLGFLLQSFFLQLFLAKKYSLEVRYEGLQIKQFIFLIYLGMEREEFFFASAALWQLG